MTPLACVVNGRRWFIGVTYTSSLYGVPKERPWAFHGIVYLHISGGWKSQRRERHTDLGRVYAWVGGTRKQTSCTRGVIMGGAGELGVLPLLGGQGRLRGL